LRAPTQEISEWCKDKRCSGFKASRMQVTEGSSSCGKDIAASVSRRVSRGDSLKEAQHEQNLSVVGEEKHGISGVRKKNVRGA